jgi:hypothetical protein
LQKLKLIILKKGNWMQELQRKNPKLYRVMLCQHIDPKVKLGPRDAPKFKPSYNGEKAADFLKGARNLVSFNNRTESEN